MSQAQFHPSLPYDTYAALPGVRSSRLRLLDKSPKHYAEAEDNDTASRVMLRAVHQLVLEGPEAVAANYCVYDGRRAGKVWDAFLAANPGRAVLNPREAELVGCIARAYIEHPRAGMLLRKPGQSEETVTWTHPATGLACKARLDRRIGSTPSLMRPSWEPRATVLDLKTYGTSQPHQIANRAAALGAHIQAAHYCEGVALALGCDITDIRYLLVCAESAKPFDVAVVELHHDSALAFGIEHREELMTLLAECIAKNEWPGAAPEVADLTLPAWADPDLAGEPDVTLPPNTEEISP